MSPVTAKVDQVMAVLAVNVTAKVLYVLYITDNMKRFNYRSRCVIWLAKRLKED